MIGLRIAALAGSMLLAGLSFGVARAAELGSGLEWWNAVADDDLAALRGRENIVEGPGIAVGDSADGNAVANDNSTAVNAAAIGGSVATDGSVVVETGGHQALGGDDSVNIAGDTGSGVVTIGDQNATVGGDNDGTFQVGDGNSDADITGDNNDKNVVGNGNNTSHGDGSVVGTGNMLGKATNDQTILSTISGDVSAGAIGAMSIADNSGIITTMMNTGSQVNMSSATVVNVYMGP